MASISKKITEKVGNIIYLNVPRNYFTHEQLLSFFTDDIKFLCFKNSSKLRTKEDIEKKGE